MYDLRPSRPSRPVWLSFAIGLLVILVLVAIALTIISYSAPFTPARPPRILATLTPVHIAIVTVAPVKQIVIVPTLTPIPTDTPVDTPTPTPTLTPTVTPTPTLSPKELADRAKQIPYRELLRNTEQYIGELVFYPGKVTQVIENNGKYAVLMNVEMDQYGITKSTVLVTCYCDTRPLEGDYVGIVGTVEGRISYQTVLGATITVPQITSIIFWITPQSRQS